MSETCYVWMSVSVHPSTLLGAVGIFVKYEDKNYIYTVDIGVAPSKIRAEFRAVFVFLNIIKKLRKEISSNINYLTIYTDSKLLYRSYKNLIPLPEYEENVILLHLIYERVEELNREYYTQIFYIKGKENKAHKVAKEFLHDLLHTSYVRVSSPPTVKTLKSDSSTNSYSVPDNSNREFSIRKNSSDSSITKIAEKHSRLKKFSRKKG